MGEMGRSWGDRQQLRATLRARLEALVGERRLEGYFGADFLWNLCDVTVR